MKNYFARKWKMFKDLFNDNNNINEKTIVGFISFVVMVLIAIIDVGMGMMGKSLSINQFIYDSFVWITLGAFGIAEVGKIFSKTETKSEPDNAPPADVVGEKEQLNG